MDQPLVSVVLPTFNCAEFLSETLDSILGQSYGKFEILLIDDGSTDHTAEVVAPYLDQVRFFRQENWGGPSRPRNVGVQNARGELVCFFDSDDVMLPGKLADAVEVFRTYPQVDLLFTNFRGWDEYKNVIQEDFLSKYQRFRDGMEIPGQDSVGLLPGRVAYSQLLLANFIGTSSVVCRKELFASVGPFDESLLNGDDIDMWRRIAFAGHQFAFLDKFGHGYRQRAGGVTSRGVKRYPAMLKGLRKQRNLELEPVERDWLEQRIRTLELDYGHALSAAGQFRQAKEVYRGVLGQKFSWACLLGLGKIEIKSLLAWVRPGGNQE